MWTDGQQTRDDHYEVYYPFLGLKDPRNDGDIVNAVEILSFHSLYHPSANVPVLDSSSLQAPTSIGRYQQTSLPNLDSSPSHENSVNYHLSAEHHHPPIPPQLPPNFHSMDEQYQDPSDGIQPSNAQTARESSRSAENSHSSNSRKGITNVVIACRQCRKRKIRCDSNKPSCLKCLRRSDECEYDAFPKRRGPDKRPGTRQRARKKRPAPEESIPAPPNKRARKSTTDIHPLIIPDSLPSDSSPMYNSPGSDSQGMSGSHYPSSDQYVKQMYSVPVPDLAGLQLASPQHSKFVQPSVTILEAQRQWWYTFLQTYSLDDIVSDVRYLFSQTGHWLAFLDVDFLEMTIRHSEGRLSIQPALLLSIVAMSTLMRSSEAEYGLEGRERALSLRDSAQVTLDKALRSEWIDATLAEAALILSFFETSLHPQYSPDRVCSSLAQLDDIISSLSLMTIDSDDPEAPKFGQTSVPIVYLEGPEPTDSQRGQPCSCLLLDPQAQQPHSQSDPYKTWSSVLPWNPYWSRKQIRDEECRRLCWCAVGLVASYTAQCVAIDQELPALLLSIPSNFHLLFPGEVSEREALAAAISAGSIPGLGPSASSSSLSTRFDHSYRYQLQPKESIWALYCRSMLLWNYCARIHRGQLQRRYSEFMSGEGDTDIEEENKVEFANDVWSECQMILDSLTMHTCNKVKDMTVVYLTKEYIYNCRITVTHTLRSLHGLSSRGVFFNRKQALEWIYTQEKILERIKIPVKQNIIKVSDLQAAGYGFIRGPFQATWFSNQLAM
ncbi:hypothetical protein D9758_011728 [Tetrapyrgos nigripes]|uniref:Zn(2)-C6 fungal-type domain-containing protein n=1 Tax=Tetrapyrgos nigripes TaxID=182062 RepID=A0A8H5LMP0_9AGAR|nr:hypothetical protein D9758_011728 [Tetrapyrgos nigripes]